MAMVTIFSAGCTTNVYNTYAGGDQQSDTGATETSEPQNDASTQDDSALQIDTAVSDTATKPDSQTSTSTDTGTTDTNVSDTTPTTTTDSGVADTAVADTNVPDTTPTTTPPAADSGTPDTAVTTTDGGTVDTGMTDTGTVTTPPPPATTTVNMTVHIRIPQWGSHNVALYSEGSPAGGPAWTGAPLASNTGKGVDVTFAINPAEKFVFNGTTDGNWSFVDYLSGTVKVAAWASVNGKPIGRVQSQRNAKGDGYDLVFIATPAKTAANDLDGDGFTTDATDPSLKDCNDRPDADGNAFYPGQVESPEDSFDFDCNGSVDPARFIIRMSGVPQGYAPIVYDVAHWPSNLPMVWNSSAGVYESSPYGRDTFPNEFTINWGGWWDSSLVYGSCISNANIQVYNSQDGTLVTQSIKVSPSSGTCHRFATP
jgi:hypothetical protein